MKPRFPLIVLSGIFTATSAIAAPIMCSETCSSKNHNIPNCAKASCIFCRDLTTEKTKEIWSCDTCNNGYKTGIDQTIQNDWLRDAYKCVLDCTGKCGTPPSPSTGTVSDPTKLYKHTTTYSCDENPNIQACDWVVDIVYSCNNSAYQSNNTVSCQKKQTASSYSCSGCTSCPDNAKCDGSTTFTCNSGFYKSGSSCASCPNNHQTCNNDGFTCKSGYYKSGDSCKSCPANSTCTSATNFTCKSGYYKSGSGCASCPNNYKTCNHNGFTCNDGFYKTVDSCKSCPANSTTCTSATNFTCKSRYYKSGDSCKSCGLITIGNQTITATSKEGATSKSDCTFTNVNTDISEVKFYPNKEDNLNYHEATIKIKSCY